MVNELQSKKNELNQDRQLTVIKYINEETIKTYIDNLQKILIKGTNNEQKTFLKSFIKSISISLPLIKIEYNIPLVTKKAESITKEVLFIEQLSGPCRTRTCDPLIMSNML